MVEPRDYSHGEYSIQFEYRYEDEEIEWPVIPKPYTHLNTPN